MTVNSLGARARPAPNEAPDREDDIFRYRHRVALWLVLLGTPFLIACGCSGMFAPDRHAKREIAVDEVIGVWKLSPQSLDFFRRDGFKSAPAHRYSIAFKADGGLDFASVISFFGNIEYIECPGRWLLGKDRHNNPQLAITLDGPRGNQSWSFSFTDNAGQLELWTFHGDPDSWELIEYKREK